MLSLLGSINTNLELEIEPHRKQLKGWSSCFFYIRYQVYINFDGTNSDFENSNVSRCVLYRLRNTLLLTLSGNISEWLRNRRTSANADIGRPSSYHACDVVNHVCAKCQAIQQALADN